MKCFVAVLSLMFTLQAFSAEKLLATINSDIDQDTGKFFLEVDEDGKLSGVRIFVAGPQGNVVRDDFHMVERIIDEGAVLVEQQGREALRLEVENFDIEKGGIVVLDHLFNGVTGSRKNIKIKLIKDQNEYRLVDLDNASVNRLFIFGNWVRIIGLVGIKEVKASFLAE